MQSNISPVEENDCESRWTTKLPPSIKFTPMKERSLNMKEPTSSSAFLSKGAVKTVSPPVLDNMTELEICCGPSVSSSSSVQANVYVDQSLSQSQSQNVNTQDPVLVIPLLPPQLSSKTLATVEQPGFIRLRLLHDLVVDISNDLTVRLYNPKHKIEVSVSESGERAAVIHPSGRALFQPDSLEAQCEDQVSLKKAKIDDRGVSFTGSNLSEVYVLTVRGLRTFLEEFPQNLYLTDYVKSQFTRATTVYWLYSPEEYSSISRKMLTKLIFETTGSEESKLQTWRYDWRFGQLSIQQDLEGVVVVELVREETKTVLKSSPNTGELRLETPAAQLSASLGDSGGLSVISALGSVSYTNTSREFRLKGENGNTSGLDGKGNLKEDW